ncbi:MAG: isoprenylcysteine carboxylmethyltransferase family protein [Thermaerobacter sp.]|nr:isoprenylcysteine carboxylmethyltransferase family protein [Thermaerobacter sp.]
MVHVKLLVWEVVGAWAVMGSVLFGAAGTVTWAAGWVFLVTFFGFVLLLARWLMVHNPGLLYERLTAGGFHNQVSWDKIFFPAINFYALAWLALMALDAVRFHWSHMPWVFQAGGLAVLLLSYALLFATFRANAYLSPVVRLQRERGQTVVTTGPYRCLRHPMYAAAALMVVGVALLLGSWIGLAASVSIPAALAWRAVQEERTLAAELSGYKEYQKHVKYRFIPFLW